MSLNKPFDEFSMGELIMFSFALFNLILDCFISKFLVLIHFLLVKLGESKVNLDFIAFCIKIPLLTQISAHMNHVPDHQIKVAISML